MTAQDHYEKAKTFYDNDDFPNAINSIEQALSIEPNSVKYLLRKGEIAINIGQFDKAVQACEIAIRLNPDKEISYYLLGKGLMHLEKFTEALDPIGNAIRLKPDVPQNHFLLAQYLFELKRFEEALEALKTGFQIDPNNSEGLLLKFTILNEIGLYEEALETINTAIHLGLDSAEVYSDRAHILYKMGQFNESLKDADTAIQLNPNLAIAHYNRGSNLVRYQRFDEALNAYKIAEKLKHNLPRLSRDIGAVLIDLERYAEGITYLDYYISLGNEDVETHAFRAYALYFLGRIEESNQAISKAIMLDPDSPVPWIIKSEIEFEEGDYEKAKNYFVRAFFKGTPSTMILDVFKILIHSSPSPFFTFQIIHSTFPQLNNPLHAAFIFDTLHQALPLALYLNYHGLKPQNTPQDTNGTSGSPSSTSRWATPSPPTESSNK